MICERPLNAGIHRWKKERFYSGRQPSPCFVMVSYHPGSIDDDRQPQLAEQRAARASPA